MKFNFFFKTFIVGLLIVFFASCDRDVNEIGSGIIGDDHYGLEVDSLSTVSAYNQNLGPVQTNNLSVNQFGYYNSPVFGKTKASFVTQLELASANPTFYSPVIDSVYLYVPYFSTFLSTDDTGDSTYELDSIYGDNKIKLSVYESTKFLENLDPTTDLLQQQKYYSNQQSEFDTYNGGFKLNNDNKNIDLSIVGDDNSQNDKFVFSEKQIKLYKDAAHTTLAERKAPGMFLNLDKTFFTTKILNAPSGKLYNNNVFKNYFRGLYFKVENEASSTEQGRLAMINFLKGTITIAYKDKTSDTDATIIRKTLTLNLAGNTVNLLDNENIFTGYTAPNPTVGDEKLFLKGGNGSMAIIDLFNKTDNYSYDKVDGHKLATTPNGVSDELDDLRNPIDGKKRIVNEANITFHIDKSSMGTAVEPNRVYLYDLTNKRPLIDFYTDGTTGTTSKYNKYVFGGIISKSSDGRGTNYKVKITNHIRNLIKYGGVGVDKDSTNVRLGLVVTESINVASNAYLASPFTTNSGTATTIQTSLFPVMSVVNPLGTILYGTNPNVPVNKRLKLKIYYTKPD